MKGRVVSSPKESTDKTWKLPWCVALPCLNNEFVKVAGHEKARSVRSADFSIDVVGRFPTSLSGQLFTEHSIFVSVKFLIISFPTVHLFELKTATNIQQNWAMEFWANFDFDFDLNFRSFKLFYERKKLKKLGIFLNAERGKNWITLSRICGKSSHTDCLTYWNGCSTNFGERYYFRNEAEKCGQILDRRSRNNYRKILLKIYKFVDSSSQCLNQKTVIDELRYRSWLRIEKYSSLLCRKIISYWKKWISSHSTLAMNLFLSLVLLMKSSSTWPRFSVLFR